jgi:predicted PurR-regulated permease PerM
MLFVQSLRKEINQCQFSKLLLMTILLFMFLLGLGLGLIYSQARADIETLQKQHSNVQHMKEKTLQDLAASETGKVEALRNIDTLQHNNNKLSQELEYLKS